MISIQQEKYNDLFIIVCMIIISFMPFYAHLYYDDQNRWWIDDAGSTNLNDVSFRINKQVLTPMNSVYE
ncbi:hypothetical protein DERF_009432 [Dermatophagoides farinae]|uniref:Uncharacterized protein n=1 Tax=Dermatophagoides farinae TaxID=6954 RepID=A0A922HXY6_DERFA|nr:hypothetical protein DERF_009432 [Dermatophagoides farinae]